MAAKLTCVLKDVLERDTVAPATIEYERRVTGTERGGRDERKSDYNSFANLYYDLVTEFYEYGWGRSFHFAPRAPRESFRASLARHEHYTALKLALRPGMRVADLGCGGGGPLREIVLFSGANVVGVNNNVYQLERDRKQTDDAGLSGPAEYLECDFMNVDAPDSSFDAVFAIEASCHVPDRASVFREAFRLLKPGGSFASYEWCLTVRFDEESPRHLQLMRHIETGGGTQSIVYQHEVDTALREAGSEVLETSDLAKQTGAWHFLVSTLGRFRSLLRQFSEFRGGTLADPCHAACAGNTQNRADRNGARVEPPEPGRGGAGGEWSVGDFSADVFRAWEAAGAGEFQSQS